MPRIFRKLSDTECRKAIAKAKDYKLYDEGNLRLLVRKTGTKVWQYPFKLNSKENIYSIGQYPQVALAEARQKRDEIRSIVAKGINPNREKAIRYASNLTATDNSFERIARDWHSRQVWDARHSQKVLSSLELNVFPSIGPFPIDKVTPQDILKILRQMEDRDALDAARRVGQRCTAIFDYAIQLELCQFNPATNRSKVLKSRKRKHRPHLSAKQIPDFLKALMTYRGSLKVRLAMMLLWLTFVRPGELRHARWEDIDEVNAIWRIPAEQMKMRRPHLVPLSGQALDILKELRPITGKSELLFPGERNVLKPISDVTLIKVLIILGYNEGGKKKGEKERRKIEHKFVPHGVRGSASTILNEIGKFKPDIIERQLAHVDKNSVRAAYNHAEYLDERVEMMQWWGNYLKSQIEG